jgi:HK97 family phage major capsid protein
MSLILEAVKKALIDGEATVNLKEASTLTASGSGVGGRVIYDDAFAPLRLANPIRYLSRVIPTIGSDEAFVVKTGDATVIQTGTTNPWNYAVQNDVGNYATTFWQISSKSINAVVPVRTAVLEDINLLDETIIQDLALEFAQQEALSMMLNNDQASGTATPQTGSTYGLRGLNFYTGSTSAASFGTSGSATTNGRHTVLQVAQLATAISYDDIVNTMKALPVQYYNDPSTAWMMHPSTIHDLRNLQASTTNATKLFSEVGDEDGGSVLYVFGFPVMPNPYMDEIGVGKFAVYLAAWQQFVTIADNEEMKIQRLEQTQPGFVTIFAEKRVCSTIRDVFAGVRLVGV